MRSWVLAVALLASACKSKGDAGPDQAALKAQAELVARRDALMTEKKKLEAERAQIDAQIKEVTANGGDTTELATKRAQLDSQIEGQSSDLDQLSGKLDQIVAKGDAAAGMASREANMGSREKGLAGREAAIAERERVIGQREAELAKREKETCGAAAPQMIIQQVAAPPPKGGYTKADVDSTLAKARTAMAKKGLVNGDLGTASGLEATAAKGLADGDLGAAHVAATQLLATVNAVEINRTFITLKYKRLNDRFTASKTDAATKEKFEKGMQEVVQLYGDGAHAAANKKLNGLAQLLP